MSTPPSSNTEAGSGSSEVASSTDASHRPHLSCAFGPLIKHPAQTQIKQQRG